MLCKTLTIINTNSYLAITDDEQYYTWLVDMDVMKCLLLKGHYCSLWGNLYVGQGHTDCALALYVNSNNEIEL